MLLATVVLSALTAKGLGGLFCIGIAGAFFGALLTTVRRPVIWLAVPVSFGGAYLLSGDLLLSLSVLLFVPVGFILAYALFFEKSFSVSVVCLTVVLLASMGLMVLVSVTEAYEGTVRQAAGAFLGDIESYFREAFASVSYPMADGQTYSLPAETVDRLIETAVMILPAVAVVTCELLAYVIAKLFRAIVIRSGFRFMLGDRSGEVTVSVGASVVYLISAAVSFFVTKASVIAYSAVNITYIFLPAMAIVGFKMLFGRRGFFRSRRQGPGRIMMIVAVAFLIFMSPIGFLQMLAVLAAVYTVGRTLISGIDHGHGGEDDGGSEDKGDNEGQH
ncbi:MAG: hypothetical protein IJD22_00615 [Clostridia bacterium]|nr:hypothetical protein [Clostridia bacterium]